MNEGTTRSGPFYTCSKDYEIFYVPNDGSDKVIPLYECTKDQLNQIWLFLEEEHDDLWVIRDLINAKRDLINKAFGRLNKRNEEHTVTYTEPRNADEFVQPYHISMPLKLKGDENV